MAKNQLARDIRVGRHRAFQSGLQSALDIIQLHLITNTDSVERGSWHWKRNLKSFIWSTVKCALILRTTEALSLRRGLTRL